MWGLFRLLGGLGNDSATIGPDEGVSTVMADVADVVSLVRTIFLAFCALLLVLYAIWIGWKFMKATDDQKRKDAKSQLIYSIIGAISVGLLIGLLEGVLGALGPSGTVALDNEAAAVAYANIAYVIGVVIDILVTAATIFAVYVGWQFMKAEDDQKRKEAKIRLLYTGLGLIGVVLLNTIVGNVLRGIAVP